jgi:hypothetical protein
MVVLQILSFCFFSFFWCGESGKETQPPSTWWVMVVVLQALSSFSFFLVGGRSGEGQENNYIVLT